MKQSRNLAALKNRNECDMHNIEMSKGSEKEKMENQHTFFTQLKQLKKIENC